MVLSIGGCASVGSSPPSPSPARIQECAPVFYGFEPENAASCVHPLLVDQADSPADFMRWLETMHERFGNAISVSEIRETGPTVVVGGYSFAVIPFLVRMQRDELEREQVAYLVAILGPGESEWRFVDGFEYAPEDIAAAFPGVDPAELLSAVVIPAGPETPTGEPVAAPPVPEGYDAEQRRRARECHETADRLKARGLEAYSERVRESCPSEE